MSTEPQLPKIANLPEKVKAFGREYEIRRFNVGQLAESLDYAPYVGALIIQAMRVGVQPDTEGIITFLSQGATVIGPALVPIISIATREPIEWINEQDDSVGALKIFVRAVVKNKDFFTPEKIAEIKEIFADLLPTDPSAGGESSTTSSAKDTATETSSIVTP